MNAAICHADSNWYSIFREAILETQREKVLPRIDRARHAISARMSELRSAQSKSGRETTDLGDALRYLAILSHHLGRDTGVLWD